MREIVLSKRAAQKLDALLDYLESEWSLKVKDSFIEELDRIFSQLKTFPEIGQ